MSVVLLAGMVGCASSECFENKNSLPYAGFYSSAPVPTKVEISGLKVWGDGVPNDSLLLDGKTASSVYLPFRIDSDETTFVFSYTPSDDEAATPIEDFITFSYTRQPWFVSAACGAVYNFKINEIKWGGTFITDVTCPPGVITNANIENLRINFNTAIDE